MAARWLRSRAFTPPASFEEYRLLRPLGQGAMGQVFLAEDTLLMRLVAIKFIASASPDATARQRFLTEARAIARLQHEAVVAVYRVGEVEGCPFLVSELLRGRSLDQLEKPVPDALLLRIAVGLARGLGAAHRRGVLHRDIKPANAFLTDEGRVKLLDFGLAKLLAQDAPVVEPLPSPALPIDPLAVADATASRPSVDPQGDPAETAQRPAAATAERPTAITERPAAATFAEALTQAGSLMGTPLYMAPEAYRGEPQSRASDVYSLGALLYELACGEPPHRAPTLEALRDAALQRDAAPLCSRAPHLDRRLCALIDQCLRREAAARPASGEELAQALTTLRDGHRGPLPSGNPYRGLSAFEAAHRALFCGRDRDTRALLERLRADPLVLCAGDSGVGKSSLCRAGVLPLAEEEGLGEERAWITATLVPGARPLLALANLLVRLGDPSAADGQAEGLRDRLLEAPAELPRLLRLRLGPAQERGAPPGLLLFIDQAEELWTLCEPAERAAAAVALGALATPAPGLRLLLCARGDYLTRLSTLPVLGAELARALYLLRPLDEAGLREAIVEPARRAGVTFESESLITALSQAGAKAVTSGGLPLLQFALSELWEARDREHHRIPAAALVRIGGVAGALARHADQVMETLRPAERAAARRLLPRLVTREGTRARRKEAELLGAEPAERAALQALVRGRLVVAREGDGEAASYEVAHEALLSGWGALREWLAEDLERRSARERLQQAAAEWQRLGRPREALYGARQLREVSQVGLVPAALAAQAATFYLASRQERIRQRLLQAGAVLLLPVLAAAAFTASSLRQRRQRDLAVAARLDEGAAALDRARAARARVDQRKEAAFQALRARDAAAGEQQWALALALAPDAEAAYRQAARALEAALLLDPARRAVRQRFAGLLAEQVQALEGGLALGPRDDLWQRLANLDDDGALRRSLEAPGQVQVRLAAGLSGALRAQRYLAGPSGRLTLSAPVFEGPLPAAALALSPGSYRLTVVVPGRPPVLAPLLLHRGERLDLPLPVPARVPEGFVYVPPGRFLFGWGEDEQVRRIFATVPPQHEATTSGFLIGRHEVTFAEWLRYLRALPADERARRTPKVMRVDQGQHLRLNAGADGVYALDLQPRLQRLRAREGEPIAYPGRRLRQAQDWLRLPVAGIGRADADAYAGWMAQSGRLPGARLCPEDQWERAARGADGRVYPHGAELLPDDANHDLTYGRDPSGFGPDEVGSHPASDSPFGVSDMAGNVWEWVRSALRANEVVYRGGSWYLAKPSARSMNRELGDESLRDVDIGLRLCAPAPPAEEVPPVDPPQGRATQPLVAPAMGGRM